MQNSFKYMMFTYLFKDLLSFLYTSVLFRKSFNDMYPLQIFFKKLHFFLHYINQKLCKYLDTYTRKLQCKFHRDPSTGYKALGILMIKTLQFEKTAINIF